jgi:hypothetical protein
MSAAAAWGHQWRPLVTSERGGVLRFRAAAIFVFLPKTAAATDECGACSQWQDKLLQCQHKPGQAQAGRATLPTPQQVRRAFLRTPSMAAARMPSASAEALLPHAVAKQRFGAGSAVQDRPPDPRTLLSRALSGRVARLRLARAVLSGPAKPEAHEDLSQYFCTTWVV